MFGRSFCAALQIELQDIKTTNYPAMRIDALDIDCKENDRFRYARILGEFSDINYLSINDFYLRYACFYQDTDRPAD